MKSKQSDDRPAYAAPIVNAEWHGPISWLQTRHRELSWAAAGLAVGAGLTWLLDLTDQTAPVWTFVGVVVVALLTVATAENRHERQVEAESVRLRQQLDGEAARQKQQLEAESIRQAERLTHERLTATHEDSVGVTEEALRLFREVRLLLPLLQLSQLTARPNESAFSLWSDSSAVEAKFAQYEVEFARLDVRMSVRFRRDSRQLRMFRETTREHRDIAFLLSPTAALIELPEGESIGTQLMQQADAFRHYVREFEDAVASQVDVSAAIDARVKHQITRRGPYPHPSPGIPRHPAE